MASIKIFYPLHCDISRSNNNDW